MPYRSLLTSCDDMNIYLVPLYQPQAGKSVTSNDTRQQVKRSLTKIGYITTVSCLFSECHIINQKLSNFFQVLFSWVEI